MARPSWVRVVYGSKPLVPASWSREPLQRRGGALAQVDLAQISYFRCHVGHHYGPQTLAAAQADTSESKIWSALAALEEEAALQRHLHQTLRHTDPAAHHERLAEEIGLRANQLREMAKAWTPLAEAEGDSP